MRVLLSILLIVLSSPVALAASDWQFRSSVDPVRKQARALISYRAPKFDHLQLAFKCQAGSRPRMLLGFPAAVHEGMAERLRATVNFQFEEGYEVVFKKFLERAVPPDMNYWGAEAEAHKLWFSREKAIIYRSTRDRWRTPPILDVLRALRDGDTFAEVDVAGKTTAISLNGSTAAVSKFAERCGLILD